MEKTDRPFEGYMERYKLSEMEHDVFSLLVLGLTREEVAAELDSSTSSVARVMKAVQDRLGAVNTVQTVTTLVYEGGWLPYKTYDEQTWETEK